MVKLLACLCLCACAASAGAAEYYRWTDANGVTHFTDKPPVGVAAEKLKSNTRAAPPAPPPAKPAAKETDGARAERAERCDSERTRLATLQKNRTVQMRTSTGELKRLSPEEHQEEIAFTQKAIEVYCNYLN